jgi:hypothetical protein
MAAALRLGAPVALASIGPFSPLWTCMPLILRKHRERARDPANLLAELEQLRGGIVFWFGQAEMPMRYRVTAPRFEAGPGGILTTAFTIFRT